MNNDTLLKRILTPVSSLKITVFLIVMGAAVNAEAERQTARDSTVGPEQPLGQRGAVVADSAPPYRDDPA